jgi:ABC-type Fe3+/spermidine/putrescine transport system ATPase subunit
LGDFQLQDIDLNIGKGEYFIILGPTGAGKTVLLEAIAGLHSILSGEIWVDSREVSRLKPEKRGIGIVYQDQALFPHLSVQDNIAFGLKLRKCPKQEIEAKIAAASELLGLSHLLHRKPETLSGGESQRVALARALVMEPDVLLLDEPLSALDPETRERLQQELERVHHSLKVTILHVTHDFEEAIALGERVAVLNEGRIVQVGTPQEILRHPVSEFVARFALSRNVFSGEAEAQEDGSALIDIGNLKLMAITELRGRVHLSLRPEDILISTESLLSTARNSFQGTVTNIEDRGAVIYVTVDVPPDLLPAKSATSQQPQDFVCLITRQSFEELELREGVRVWLTFKASAVHVF